jgi:hypothetical protein
MCASMLLCPNNSDVYLVPRTAILNIAGTADGLILAFLCLMCIYASRLICFYACPADISRTAAPCIRRFSEKSQPE